MHNLIFNEGKQQILNYNEIWGKIFRRENEFKSVYCILVILTEPGAQSTVMPSTTPGKSYSIH